MKEISFEWLFIVSKMTMKNKPENLELSNSGAEIYGGTA